MSKTAAIKTPRQRKCNNDHEIIIDSDASDRVASDMNIFTNLKRKGDAPIEMGDGMKATLPGKGAVVVKKKGRSFTLETVYYIPPL